MQEDLRLPTGAHLVAASFRPPLTECGNELGGVDRPRWFLLQGLRSRFLGDALAFIAATDPDAANGQVYLFWYSGYNRDGYVLFDATFREPVRFLWRYH